MENDANIIVVPPAWYERSGSVAVKVSPEKWTPNKTGIPAIRYKIKWTIGKHKESKIKHTEKDAKLFAKEKAKELDSEHRPASVKSMEEQRRDAVLYRECCNALYASKMDPLTACRFMARLLELMDLEGVEKLVAVILPQMRKCQPLLVETGVKAYSLLLFKDGEPQTPDEKRKHRCFELFNAKYAAMDFRFVSAQMVKDFLDEATASQDIRNKFLYALRGLFDWARDFKMALPAHVDTVCDFIIGKKPEKSDAEIYDVMEFAWLASFAVDREMVCALTLSGQHFVRQDEAKEMKGEYFTRDADGTPYQIVVPAHVSKTEEERTIPINEKFQSLFKVLIPFSGRIFNHGDPFDRIERLARVLGIRSKKNGFRHTCVSSNICAGMKRAEAANRAGHDEQTQGTFYFVNIDQREAKKYERINFNLRRVEGLPAYRQVRYKKYIERRLDRPLAEAVPFLRNAQPSVTTPEVLAA